jgi:hypothetical protein
MFVNWRKILLLRIDTEKFSKKKDDDEMFSTQAQDRDEEFSTDKNVDVIRW